RSRGVDPGQGSARGKEGRVEVRPFAPRESMTTLERLEDGSLGTRPGARSARREGGSRRLVADRVLVGYSTSIPTSSSADRRRHVTHARPYRQANPNRRSW